MKSAGPGQRGRIKKALSISVEPEGEEEDDLDLLQWTAGVRQNATPPSDLISEDDTPMIDSDDETVAWIDSPTYAKYKPILGTPISEVCSEDEMQNEITKANLEREDAAKSLLRLHWYGEPDLTDEGAAMILLNLRAEAQDIQMGMPSDLND
ncbi:uncharacterized protein RCC_09662 [Ramularia collo-cygni]|uniref:Uncharacterized protein n=1 Tax=Ramularia collo-cygni TaxID=112498 RepID=A0A2D3V3J6_9PEZI|nr:uncharacterized protein RCC_09662 [Ramularia collo-cygni]CZT23946.1 uncharacterized protein RCC_09662 [Ramularia collo-cygni]